MSVADLIHRAEVAGLELVPEGETFRIYGTGPKPMELLRELKAHRQAVRAALVGTVCSHCGSTGVRLVPTYWTDWESGLCPTCCRSQAAEYERRGSWPSVPWDDTP